MYLAEVIELFIIHELVLSEPWFTLVITCDDGWLELGAVCRLCIRACVVLTSSSSGCIQRFNRISMHRTAAGTSGRAVISHCSAFGEGRLNDPFYKGCKPPQWNRLDLAYLFSEEKAVPYESIALHKHFLSCLFSLPHSLLFYKPLIPLIADKGQKQKLVEIRAREV